MTRRRAWWMAMLLLAPGTPPAAQQVLPLRSLVLQAWDQPGGAADYRYLYRLAGPRTGTWGVVELDIRVPRAAGGGTIATRGGTWLGDDAQALTTDTTWGRVPLEVSIPPRWSAFTATQGTLVWMAPQRDFGRTSDGVRPGQVLDGLMLRSPGVPSLRRVTLARSLPIPPEDPSARAAFLAAFPMEQGWVVGPGRPAGHLSLWSLAEEARAWCEARVLAPAPCERWRATLLAAIKAARLASASVLAGQWAQMDQLLAAPDLPPAAREVLGLHVGLVRRLSVTRMLWDVPAGF